MSPTAGTKIKFISSDADGLPLNRRQVQRACSPCRKKKKRCTHGHGLLTDPFGRSVDPNRPLIRRPRSTTQTVLSAESEPSSSLDVPSSDALTEAASSLIELSSSRFIGDLNPEGIFLQATNTSQDDSCALYRDRSDIGSWLPPADGKSGRDGSSAELDQNHTQHKDSPTASNLQYFHSTTLSGRLSYLPDDFSWFKKAMGNYISEVCLPLVPPDDDFDALRTIFLEKIHPIFPVFNTNDIAGEHPHETTKIAIKQVISLAAATDPHASAHLRLKVGGPLLTFGEFHHRLAHSVFLILDANMLVSHVDHIRLLTILSFFYQPASASERNLPSLLCSQAIHHVQNLGIQLLGYRPQRQDENVDQLFCVLWALDRITAALYGRPCLFHERDVDRDLDDCIEKQPPCFRLILRVIQHLDRVIELYRPRKNGLPPLELPVFENMVLDAGAEKAPSVLLGTIEVLYHAVSVLSVRQPLGMFDSSAPKRAYLPHHSINSRRSLSADRIFMAVQSEEIALLPFIPYAVSLSLSVSYRKMRHSRLPMYRARARGVFRETVNLLRKIGDIYSSAKINADLGESILREMEKTTTSLATIQYENPTADQRATARIQPHAQSIATNTGYPSSHQIRLTKTGNESMENDTVPEDSLNLETNGDVALSETTKSWNMDDIDLFGYFDPEFNLGAADTALEANLDMSFPQNWITSGHQISSFGFYGTSASY